IAHYLHADPTDRRDFVIGCRILTQPFFLDEVEWIPVPASWARNIVSFKTYSTDDADGRALWAAVQERIERGGSPVGAAGGDGARARGGGAALRRSDVNSAAVGAGGVSCPRH